MKKVTLIMVTVFAISALSVCATDVKELYKKDCAKCHGDDGKGDTKMGKKSGAKDYSEPKVQEALKDDAAFKAIKEGLKDKEGKVVMKPIEEASDDDVKGLVAYMRTFMK